jgi:stress-induced-phosphoprotein 1
MEKYAEAIETYQQGLKHDPSNEQLKEALANCQDNLEASQFEAGGGGGAAGFNPFGNPNFLANLAMNPKTRDLLSDPEVQELVKSLQKNPNDIAKLLNHPKASLLLGAMFGGMGGNGMNPFAGEEEETTPRSTPSSAQAEAPKKPEAKPDPRAGLTPEQRKVRFFLSFFRFNFKILC